ncbi:hypothetical protein R3P38DRAFT_3190077 [Favolaschia claudopus]|uniref:Uncharacterized protein n=1 Tax=Favolaschia claudopus TaxID=2862362 RepID=A0AAW0BPI6_9AGAR
MTPDASAITYEMATTTVMYGLPKNQKIDVLRKIRQRYYESGHAESPIRLSRNLEIQARAKFSYDVASTYFQNEHNAGIRRAEEHEDESLFDSDDDVTHQGPPAELVFWNATEPTPAEVAAARGEEGHEDPQLTDRLNIGMLHSVDTSAQEEEEPASWVSAPPRHFMDFVPASRVNAEVVEQGWSMFSTREQYEAAASGTWRPDTEGGADDNTASSAAGSSADNTGPTEGASETPSPRHLLRIIALKGYRDVDCGCTDGTHDEHRVRKSFAFNANDGTVVVKTMRTMLLPLN